MAELLTAQFWAGVMAVIGVNIVLSADNAVVIALAARSLPPAERRRAIAWGSVAALATRIVLTIAALELLRLPYLKLIGAALLFWIAIRLMLPHNESDGAAASPPGFWGAIRTILLADLVMSLDNVLAVAAAAQGSLLRLAAGLAISVPLVVFASTLLAKLMERHPVIIRLGAALLGWVAGEMLVSDPLLNDRVERNAPLLRYAIPAAAALAVVLTSRTATPRSPSR